VNNFRELASKLREASVKPKENMLKECSDDREIDEVKTDEHITTSGKRDLNFSRNGREYGGWIEGRDENSVDVVVTLDGKQEFEKELPISDIDGIANAIIDCAERLTDNDNSETESDGLVDEDMLLPVKPADEKDDDRLYDDEDEETLEELKHRSGMRKPSDNTPSKQVKDLEF
jgi:hypothetical protein